MKEGTYDPDMGMRDWLAGRALNGALAYDLNHISRPPIATARFAYEMADAMMEVR